MTYLAVVRDDSSGLYERWFIRFVINEETYESKPMNSAWRARRCARIVARIFGVEVREKP